MSLLQRVVVCIIGILPSLLQAEPGKIPHGTVELISAVNSVEPGSTLELGLSFHLEPGWHIYWKNPGDSGLPPRVTWQLPAGLTAGAIDWPVPKRILVGPLLDYGYADDVLLPIPLRASPELPLTRSQDLKGNLRVLVCRETCMPGKAALALSLPIGKGSASPIASNRKLFDQARNSRPESLPSGLQVSARQSGPSILLNVTGAAAGANISFIPAEPNQIENAAPQHLTAVSGGQQLALKKSADSDASRPSLDGLLSVNGTAYAISAELLATATGSPQGSAPRPAPSQNLITVLLLAFGGGLILNLMPCVFPVLSIKVLSLLDHSGGERRTIRLSAAVYTLGVLVSFWVLVAVLLILRAAGRSLGWGFQLQSPGFVAFLVCLLFVLGLSLIGAFEIGASAMNFGSGLTQRGKYSSSFFTGVLATVVATPCTAPLMGVAVGFALGQSTAVCATVFTIMALGLASPFLLLSVFPQLTHFLPRPGVWMETLKQIMAFPVFATVIWLLWVLGQQVGISQLAALLFTLLVLSIAAWIAGRWPRNSAAKIVAAIVGIGVVVYCSATLTPLDAASLGIRQSHAAGALKWEPFTPQKLASYRSSGKPVLIDFTAAWCLTCQVNDRVVFHSPEVEQRLNRSDIALLRADWTSYDPTITEWLARFGRSGIPFYVIYGPKGAVDPVTLPDGILTPSAFLRTLGKLNL